MLLKRICLGRFLSNTQQKSFYWSLPVFPQEEYSERKNKLFEAIGDKNAIVIIPSYRFLHTSQNIFLPFHQNPNLLYLTGLSGPDCIAVFEHSSNNAKDKRVKFTAFAKGDEPKELQWNGPRLSPEIACLKFGADDAHELNKFGEYIKQAKADGKTLYAHCAPENDCLREWKKDLNGSNDISPFIEGLRVCKSVKEQEVMSKAAFIAAQSFASLHKNLPDFNNETCVLAHFEYNVRRRGAKLAYVPVVAGSPRSLILHYTHNSQALTDCHSLLIDAGAQYEGYCSDISRTYPLPLLQKNQMDKKAAFEDLYGIVKAVQLECIELLRNAMLNKHRLSLDDLHIYSMHCFQSVLPRQLKPILRHIYPHSIGHYLGLDLHDCPLVSTDIPLRPGMVITVEPGLYIPEEISHYGGIGIRIEDDVLLTEQGCTILSQEAPK